MNQPKLPFGISDNAERHAIDSYRSRRGRTVTHEGQARSLRRLSAILDAARNHYAGTDAELSATIPEQIPMILGNETNRRFNYLFRSMT